MENRDLSIHECADKANASSRRRNSPPRTRLNFVSTMWLPPCMITFVDDEDPSFSFRISCDDDDKK